MRSPESTIKDGMTVSSRGLLRSGAIFVAANLFAGLLHYFYQVAAAKQLSAEEFANLNAWFADLALFFAIGGVLQYAANFSPAGQRLLRQAIVASNVLMLLSLFAWLGSPPGQSLERALAIIGGSTVFAWLTGQVQARLMFTTMSASNLAVGAAKLSLAITPVFALSTPERYRFALFACYFPGLWLISWLAWRASAVSIKSTEAPGDVSSLPGRSWQQRWSAPILLSLAGALIPQMDMVLLARILPQDVFVSFARASLFYKGIYFLMLIFAHWLLPQQLRSQTSKVWSYRQTAISIALILAVSVGATVAAPFVGRLVFGWSTLPPSHMVFLSCLNMCLLTWIFLLIQKACAQRRPLLATFALGTLFIEAPVQLALGSSLIAYFTLAVTLQAITIVVVMAKTRSDT